MKKALRILMLGFLAMALPAATISQPFIENGVTFDNISAFVFTPGLFNGPGMFVFSDVSWTDINHNAHWSEASGNTTASLGFNLNFDYTGTPVLVHLYSFLNGSMNGDSAQFTFNGAFGNPDISPLPAGQFALDVAASVPEPATLGLLGLGLLAIGLTLKRRTNGR